MQKLEMLKNNKETTMEIGHDKVRNYLKDRAYFGKQ